MIPYSICGVIVIKKAIVFISSLLLLGCTSVETNEDEALRTERDEAINTHESIGYPLELDALTTFWKVEDDFIGKETADEDTLLKFPTEYLMDEEKYDSLNESEQDLVFRLSGIISKLLDDRYKDESEFNKDKDEFYHILKHGEK